MSSADRLHHAIRAAALGILAVLVAMSVRVPSVAAATTAATLTGSGEAAATVTVFSDGLAVTDTGDVPWDVVGVAVASTGAPVADCWPAYFASFGWNRHCLSVGGGGGWFSFTSAAVNGLHANTTYRITIGFSTNSPHTGPASVLSPTVTTEVENDLLTIGPPSDGSSGVYQITLTLSTNVIENEVWTVTQRQLNPSGGQVPLGACPSNATLGGGNCHYALAVSGGGSAALTIQNQQFGGAGYVYAYQAVAGDDSSDAVVFANAPTAAVTTTPTSATLTWPSPGNDVDIQALGNVADAGCGGTTGVNSGWLGTEVDSVVLTGLSPNTLYTVCTEASVPDQPATPGGSVPTWWVPASPRSVWTLAQPPTALAITEVAQNGFSVSWSGSGNPRNTSYEVEVLQQSQGVVVVDQLVTAPSLDVADLACGTTYRAQVRAANAAGVWTVWVPAGEVATVPCAPSILNGRDGGLGWSNSAGQGWVTLTWPAVEGAEGYRVWIFDGHQYDAIDVGDVTSWDSRTWLGYPTPAMIASEGDNSICGDPYLSGARGTNLSDDPSHLYRRTCGTAYDAAHNYWFRVSAYNASGDSGIDWSVGFSPTLPIQTDTIPPRVTEVTLNDGRTYAYGQQVPVTIQANDDASGICAVAVSADAIAWTTSQVDGCTVGQATAEPLTYLSTFTSEVTAGPGTKTEYVKVEDTAGNWSAVATGTVYVQSPPPPEVALAIDGALASTTSPDVTLTVQAVDTQYPQSQLQMRFSDDAVSWSPWQPFAGTVPWSIPPTPGQTTVYAQVQNPAGAIGQAVASIRYAAGNQSLAGQDTSGALVPYDGVMAWATPTPIVVAQFTVPSGAVAMQVSADDITWSQPEPPAAAVPIVLTTGDGLKTVYARYINAEGQATTSPAAYFLLDTTPPQIQSATWLGDAAASDDGSATLVLQATDNVTPAGALHVTVSGAANWAGLLPETGIIPLALNGHGYVVATVTVADLAGNRSSIQLGIYN